MNITIPVSFLLNVAVAVLCAQLLNEEMKEHSLKQEKERTDILLEVQTALEVGQKAWLKKQQICLTDNIYFEARNEGELGQIAVAWVTINRVNSDEYPDTVCEVVQQAVKDKYGKPKKGKCQFSWYCDGKSDDITDLQSWLKAKEIALDVMTNYGKDKDPTGGSVMYHADYVTPSWSDAYKRQVQIDSHIFYVKGN